MSASNEDGNHPENKDSRKQQRSACGPGCGCQPTTTPGRMRWLIGSIVLAAAGLMVVRAVVKSDGLPNDASVTAFADPVAAKTATRLAGAAQNPEIAVPATETSVGRIIAGFSELNAAAGESQAVFVFLPGREGASANPPFAAIKGAARLIESQGSKCGLFTLKAGSRDYEQVAAQVRPPVVLAMVKGGGMSAVSGDITETKLAQAYVAASKAGACGPTAGAGCCPK